jgi:uncharacterized SAM-binding protein YcdF (DUF218 family)
MPRLTRIIGRALYYIILFVALILVVDAALVFGFARIRKDIPKSDAIIILGAAINSRAAYNRALEGLRLYEDGKAPVIVASGGKISEADISEAQYIQKVIGKNTQKTPMVILEDQSGNTYENIKNSRAKLPEAKSVIIVSDSFHLARGVLLAKKFGFETVSWSSPQENLYHDPEIRYYYVREMMALIGYIPRFLEK